ncbi:CBN-SNA-1 protein [Caenorhabditis brenneri]|uniref:CBN-SNA-1 protein n=1 Tax=Caenorhabditis brenneri TaxID=135651 RepID=G0PLZ4_CAEBE|nr:CBN-SNA-1 protein [Caenorhabditis brenneri]
MADKKDYAAIAELEKQIAENATNFEKWKNANVLQRGSIEYNEGVTRFTDWDRDLRARLATHHGMNVESGPKSIDAVLDELLDKVDLRGFAQAIHIANSADPTFYQCLVQGFNNFKMAPAKPVFQMPRNQYYPGFTSTPYGYAAPQITANIPAYRPAPPPMIKIQRPVSPVRDYQKKTGAPFRDFSV